MRKVIRIIFLWGLALFLIIPSLQAQEPNAYQQLQDLQKKETQRWTEARDRTQLKKDEAKILKFIKEKNPQVYRQFQEVKAKDENAYWQVLAGYKVSMQRIEEIKKR